jgi:hypothetical protein
VGTQSVNQFLQSRLEVFAASPQSSFDGIPVLSDLIRIVAAARWYDSLEADTTRQL